MALVQKVLIVGGGIGGLTLASALKRRGIACDIVEVKKDWTVYGVGIIQPSNMLRALDSIGLADACVASGGAYDGWDICGADGVRVDHVPSPHVTRSELPALNGIRRTALHTVLTQAADKAGVPVRLGTTVESFEQRADGVDVKFTDGSSGRYDLVVGADGLNSRMRALLFGDGLKPRYTGQCVFRYSTTRPASMKNGMLFWGHQSKAGLVPMSKDTMYLLLVVPESGDPHKPDADLPRLLRERLAEYGGLVAEVRDRIKDSDEVIYRPFEVILVPQPWHRGRVVLMGDAAHSGTAHLAQGAAMAIEDAVLLAELLAERAALPQALDEFNTRRLPRCKLVYEVGLQLGEWENADWAGRPVVAGTEQAKTLGQALHALTAPI